MSTSKTFALDPTLPWLFSDRTMQEPQAFRNVQTLKLPDGDAAYEPMSLYFPGGTTLAMREVTSLDQLVEGAAYWHVHAYYEENVKKVVNYYSFGRYTGLAYPESKETSRRWKKGEAHIMLECDVLETKYPLRDYHLHEDGTRPVFVNVGRASFGPSSHTLYKITHYVNLPASLLAGLGVDAVKHSGLTLRQATWLKQEAELLNQSVELTMQMRGGLGLPDYRVVLPFEQVRDFLSAQESCGEVTPGQARKCKAGSLAITMRHSHSGRGRFSLTEHYKLPDAAILIDWMRHHSTVQDAALNAAISRQTIAHIAQDYRARLADEAQAAKSQTVTQSAQTESFHLPIPAQYDYRGVEELAHAA